MGPQQATPPSFVRAQVRSRPAPMAVTPPARPATSTGTELLRRGGSTAWPYPQQVPLPLVMSAHVGSVPADNAVTPLASPMTSTGTLRSVVVPSPSQP